MLQTFAEFGVPYKTNSVIDLVKGVHLSISQRRVLETIDDIQNEIG
jgi:hypothetical protein